MLRKTGADMLLQFKETVSGHIDEREKDLAEMKDKIMTRYPYDYYGIRGDLIYEDHAAKGNKDLQETRIIYSYICEIINLMEERKEVHFEKEEKNR